MLKYFSNRWSKQHSVLTLIVLMASLSFIQIPPLDVDAVSAGGYKVGVKPGDWIEYDLSWAVAPPWNHTIWIRREILDVEDTNITVHIMQKLSDGSYDNRTQKGDVAKGTGASAMVIIPADLKPGDVVYIEGFDDVEIEAETVRVYLGIERVVLHAKFSSHGFDIDIFWDKKKGVALEIHSSSSTARGTTKIAKTNLWDSEFLDNEQPLSFGTLILIIIIAIILAFAIRWRLTRSKRRIRRRRRLSSSRALWEMVNGCFCAVCISILSYFLRRPLNEDGFRLLFTL